jgi:hypothetical protein
MSSKIPALLDVDTETFYGIPPTNWVLHSYVLRVSKSQCGSCGHIAASSQLHELYAPVHGQGKRRLRPINSQMASGYPLALEQMPVTGTPICHECVSGLSPLPSNEALRLFGKRFATPYRGPSNFDPPEPKKPKGPTSILDIDL